MKTGIDTTALTMTTRLGISRLGGEGATPKPLVARAARRNGIDDDNVDADLYIYI